MVSAKHPPEGSRISLDVDPSFHRLVERAAAVHHQTLDQYVLEAINDRLREDGGGESDADAMTASADPVLAELWNNPKDAGYDHH